MAGGISSRGMEALEAMTSDLDIYRAVNELIKRHGGKAVWVRIAKAVEELLSDKQIDGAANRLVFPSGAPSERGTAIGRVFPSPNWQRGRP